MNRDLLIEKMNALLEEEFEVSASAFQPTASVKDVLELDSLDYVDLVVILEGNFGIKVKQDDFSKMNTFENLYDFVIEKMQPSIAA